MILLFLCEGALAVVPTVRQHRPVVITQKRVITTALYVAVSQVHRFDRREAPRRSTKRLEKVRRQRRWCCRPAATPIVLMAATLVRPLRRTARGRPSAERLINTLYVPHEPKQPKQ